MPHEVIMPALGMTQDTGLIVSWHKSIGDSVAVDDVLFEVETDKATMEVTADAKGFVTEIRAEAGDEVPVGNVIALIGDSVDTRRAEASRADEPVVEGVQIIMPALGMAQDSGLIVAWHKNAGDAVAASDVLFEVETDKAVMDVEAGHGGYVAALYAEAGQEAPVGSVIAVISPEKPVNPIQVSQPAQTEQASSTADTAVQTSTTPTVDSSPSSRSGTSRTGTPVAPGALSGPLLASPKARRLAAEAGLDLARLQTAGYPMPYHVADLETLRSLPDAATTGTPHPSLHLTARIPQAEFNAFAESIDDEASRHAVWASFAAAVLRTATAAENLAIRTDQPLTGQTELYTNPDLAPISQASGLPPDQISPDLILCDITGSRITGSTQGTAAAPTLTIASTGDDFTLTLEFTPGQLEQHVAITTLDGFAARLEEPLCHLL